MGETEKKGSVEMEKLHLALSSALAQLASHEDERKKLRKSQLDSETRSSALETQLAELKKAAAEQVLISQRVINQMKAAEGEASQEDERRKAHLDSNLRSSALATELAELKANAEKVFISHNRGRNHQAAEVGASHEDELRKAHLDAEARSSALEAQLAELKAAAEKVLISHNRHKLDDQAAKVGASHEEELRKAHLDSEARSSALEAHIAALKAAAEKVLIFHIRGRNHQAAKVEASHKDERAAFDARSSALATELAQAASDHDQADQARKVRLFLLL